MPIRPAVILFLLSLILSAFVPAGCSRDESSVEYERAETLLGDGKYEEALKAYLSIIEAHPGGAAAAESQYKVAFIYGNHLKDRRKALDAYAELFYLYPKSKALESAAYERATLYSSAGEHLSAAEDLKWLVKNGKGNGRDRYRYALGLEYIKAGDFAGAREEFRALANPAHDNATVAQARLRIADTHFLDGNHAEAIEAYGSVLEADADADTDENLVVEAKYGMALALDASGRTQEALETLRALYGKYPNADALRTRVAFLEKKLGKTSGDR